MAPGSGIWKSVPDSHRHFEALPGTASAGLEHVVPSLLSQAVQYGSFKLPCASRFEQDAVSVMLCVIGLVLEISPQTSFGFSGPVVGSVVTLQVPVSAPS